MMHLAASAGSRSSLDRTDDSGNSASCTQKVTLLYNWTGFFQPVDNRPTRNAAKPAAAFL